MSLAPTSQSIDEERQAFQTWLEKETSCSGGTPQMYASYISRLDTPLDPEQLTLEQAQSLLQDKVTTGSVRAAFKKYLKYCKQEKDLSIDHQRDIAFLENTLDDLELSQGNQLDKSEVLRKYLERDKIQEIVNHVAKELTLSPFGGNQRWYDEFYVMPLFLFETGCRISELIGKQHDPQNTGLRVADINFGKNQIRIRNAKGNKDRFADFHTSEPLLRTYLGKHDVQTGKAFHIPYWRVNYVFRKLGKEVFGFPGPNEAAADGEYRLTAHWMRHSFATNWVIKEYQKTGRWAEAKERVHNYLDHDQMGTTEAYIGAAKELERDNIFEEQGGFGIELPDTADEQ
jgi:integrase